jgi:hypothetical protein
MCSKSMVQTSAAVSYTVQKHLSEGNPRGWPSGQQHSGIEGEGKEIWSCAVRLRLRPQQIVQRAFGTCTCQKLGNYVFTTVGDLEVELIVGPIRESRPKLECALLPADEDIRVRDHRYLSAGAFSPFRPACRSRCQAWASQRKARFYPQFRPTRARNQFFHCPAQGGGAPFLRSTNVTF